MSKPSTCKFTPFLHRCRVACEPERHSTIHPRKRPSNAKMTVETVETVVAAAPYAALIGHKLRPLLSDSQSALADCEEDVIQICHLLSRNGKLSLVRLTKSFPTIPNLRGIANANQNDERFKMWSVMLLCTIRAQGVGGGHNMRIETAVFFVVVPAPFFFLTQVRQVKDLGGFSAHFAQCSYAPAVQTKGSITKKKKKKKKKKPVTGS